MSFIDCIIIIASVFFSANTVSDKMNMRPSYPAKREPSEDILLFLCGDVMTGRGIDQILPYSVDPQIYEPYVKDAGDYVRMAEKTNGLLDAPVSFSYIREDAKKVRKQNHSSRHLNFSFANFLTTGSPLL